MYKVVYRSQGRSNTGWVIETGKGIVNDAYYESKAEAQKKLDLLKALGFVK